MLNVTITMLDKQLKEVKAEEVSIINGVEQLKDLVLNSVFSWLESRKIASKTFEILEGNPVLHVEMKNGETYKIIGNMNEAKKQ